MWIFHVYHCLSKYTISILYFLGKLLFIEIIYFLQEDGIHQASVSFIDENGTVHIQFVSETLDILLNQMEYIEDGTYEKYRVKDYSQLFPDKLYLLDQNSEKHRVKIINATSLNGQVSIFLNFFCFLSYWNFFLTK